MNNKRFILFSMIFILVSFACTKSTLSGNSGLFFYSLEKTPWLLRPNTSGLNIENRNISFFYSNEVSGEAARWQLKFNIDNKSVSHQQIFNHDSAHFIIELFSAGEDRFIARTKNLTIDTIVYGEVTHPEKLELIDLKGNIYKEFKVGVYSFGFPAFSGLLPLANGNYIACIGYRSVYFRSVRMCCLDKNLNLIWEKDIYTGKRSSRWVDFLGNQNSFYVLTQEEFGVDMVKTYEVDFSGMIIDSTDDLTNGVSALRILPSTNGFKVLGSYYDAAKQNCLAMVSYDKNCNFLSVKYLGNENFIENNEDMIFDNLTFEFNPLDYQISNILYRLGKYYFTLMVIDKSGNKQNTKNKFVRINENDEVELIRTFEKGDLNTSSYKTFIDAGPNRFISICSGKWNKTPGISFIELDSDGKILN